MGLDWNPGNKPKPGCEDEFFRLFDLLRSSPAKGLEDELERFFEISISAYETLAAPLVGVDPEATDWIVQAYHRQEPEITLDEWVRQFDGFYVVPLVPPCDGLPLYSNGSPGGYVEPFSFRADFLKDAVDILGEDLLTEAWGSKAPEEMKDYAGRLQKTAEVFASRHGIDLTNFDTTDMESVGAKLDIIISAARWCLYWAERGHVLDAYW